MTCWPGTVESAVTLCPVTGRMRLTSEFELYTQNQDHWTLNATIRNTFPEASYFGVGVREGNLWGTSAGKEGVGFGSESDDRNENQVEEDNVRSKTSHRAEG